MQLESLLVEPRPRVRGRERGSLCQVITRRSVSDGGLRLLAGEDVHPEEGCLLVGARDQIDRAIQLADHREYVLGGRIDPEPGE